MAALRRERTFNAQLRKITVKERTAFVPSCRHIAKCRRESITYNVSDKLKADLGKLMNLCESTHKRFIREIAVKKVMEHAEKEVAAANAFLETAREAVREAENEHDTPTTQDEGEGARPDDWIPDGAMVPVPAEPLGPLR